MYLACINKFQRSINKFHLSTVSFGMSGSAMFYFVNLLTKIFVEKSFENDKFELNFNDIYTRQHFWEYLKTAFLDTVYREGIAISSDHHNHTDSGIPNILPNKYPYMLGESLFLGPPRLRQLRVRNGTCSIHKLFRKSFLSKCYGIFSLHNEDRSMYRTRGEM